MRRALLLLSTLTLAAACGDATRSVGPVMGNVPGFAISDGANTGGGPANGDFFFLPPMVPDPSGSLTYDAGAFDAGRQPRVEICRLTTVEPRLCAESIRTFSAAEVAVSTADEQYQVNWHTDEDNLALDQLYRIQVQVPRHEHDGVVQYHTLGYADVDPVNSGKELKNVATGEVIGLVDGRTLPIKFRIERSPRCEGSDDCVEAVVGDEGGRVETETGYAIAEFSEGWLPDGFDEVVVAIRRVPIGGVGQDPSCHGTTHVQYEGCYDFQTFPDVGTFAAEVVISTCIEPDAAAYESQLQLAASDDGTNFRILPPRVVTIECEGFQGTAAPIGFLGRIGERMLAFGERVGVALAPRKLYAVDKGRGGAIDGFSHGGWVLPMSVNRLAPSDEVHVAAPGSAVPVSVMVRSAHESDVEGGTPLAGLPVIFSVSGGGGSVDVSLVLTNSDGVASTTWTVGAPGGQLLTASVGAEQLTIAATVIEETGAEIIFGVNSGDDGLSYIDPATGTATFVGPLSADPAEFTTPVAMARHPDGRLLVWNNSGTTSTGVLAVVNACSGLASHLSDSPSDFVIGALAIDGEGALYGFGSTSEPLYSINSATGSVTSVGTGIGTVMGGADFGADGVLYAVNLAGNGLYTVDTGSGSATLIADLTDDFGTIGSIAFDGAGRLWGSAFGGEGGDVLFEISVDPETLGAISNVIDVSSSASPQGMAFGAAPNCNVIE